MHVCIYSALVAALLMSQEPASTTQATETQPAEAERFNADTLAGLKFRSIGPALMSGRISDLAVDPNDHSHYWVAVASGNVWKTTNGGTTFTPVFDDQGAYSIGCLAMDPHNPHVVWVGTGENNSQRSVSFGDGVYRTRDGGTTWEHLGLPQSEHIGMIAIDPRDSDVVYVAAQGPLWRAGGDRGLYKTIDGGLTWQRILHISDDTGVNEVHLDPRDPDVLYASAWQRRRHVWTLINGGPESALYKSTDAGQTWRKLTHGLPEVDLGRIGLDISPANPDIIYAIIEAADDKGGVFRSTNRGETWEKRSDYMSNSPQYYNELVCDPLDPNHVYSLDTFLHETRDGGQTFTRVPRENRHVDDHALWINPTNTRHMLVGCDGGVYESYDAGTNWAFKPNLPITQFYRVAVDNSTPFYYVYGGTQDNSTLGGPSRTTDRVGIANEHWFIAVGGDGFEPQIDPQDPNIVYAQWQYGGLIRHDRRSGEIVDIKPRELPGNAGYRWNWDSPLLISPHNRQRLYFAANKVFRSNDGGKSWQVISPDLTRQLDRNQLEIMGRIWPPDAVAKHHATSLYGTIVSLTESPIAAGLLYAGTDDGVIAVSEDSGETWRRIETFPDIPDLTYVSGLTASLHDVDTVYACFDNHKRGDFTPYILKSTNRGRTWTSLAGDLPAREVCYTLLEDHVEARLLFVGTEFGVYYSPNAGEHWLRLKGGLPTIAAQDIAIQRRENDLVLGTFGRSFYILDDYTPLRLIDEELLDGPAALFPVKPALRYIPKARLGGRDGRGWQGASFYAAPNPPYGAIFTYYLRDKLETRKEQRHEREEQAVKAGEDFDYPTLDEFRAEQREREPQLLFTIHDAAGKVVRRITAPREAGIHRIAWDLRYPATTPVDLSAAEHRAPWWSPPQGSLAPPGVYTVTMSQIVDGDVTDLAGPASFDVIPLGTATFAAKDHQAVHAFQRKLARLRRAVLGSLKVAQAAQQRINHLRQATLDTPAANLTALTELEKLDRRLKDLLIELRGDPVASKRDLPQPPSIRERVETAVRNVWHATSPPTQTQRDAYQHASDQFAPVLTKLRTLVEDDLAAVERKLEDAGAPWTPTRFPDWQPE